MAYKTELRELKTREARVMGDFAELEDENISLQKQLMQLKQAQVQIQLYSICEIFWEISVCVKSSVTGAVFINNSSKQDSLICNLFCSHVVVID